MSKEKFVLVRVYLRQIDELRKLIPKSSKYSDSELVRVATDFAIQKMKMESENRSEAEEIKEILREILEIVKKLENKI